MHILLATDAQWILNEIVAILGTPSTSFTVVSDGRDVSDAVKTHTPDLAILDLQSGSMGAMAVAMNLRLDHSSGNAPLVPVLMLLDRVADVHLARRSGADGWIIKPLDALRLRRAVTMVLDGDVYQEGLPTNADVLTNQ
ncbi:MAG: response regulator [Actinobacteria bacterium]|nr:response regulator [Actinomycetota bacterium]